MRLIAPPTVTLELAYLSESADEDDVRTAAQTALRSLASKWGIQPVNLVPVGHGIVDAIAAKIRARDLLPDEETHDALILAESAVLGCSMLLTSDAHLRAVDHPHPLAAAERLTRRLADHCQAARDCAEISPLTRGLSVVCAWSHGFYPMPCAASPVSSSISFASSSASLSILARIPNLRN